MRCYQSACWGPEIRIKRLSRRAGVLENSIVFCVFFEILISAGLCLIQLRCHQTHQAMEIEENSQTGCCLNHSANNHHFHLWPIWMGWNAILHFAEGNDLTQTPIRLAQKSYVTVHRNILELHIPRPRTSGWDDVSARNVTQVLLVCMLSHRPLKALGEAEILVLVLAFG